MNRSTKALKPAQKNAKKPSQKTTTKKSPLKKTQRRNMSTDGAPVPPQAAQPPQQQQQQQQRFRPNPNGPNSYAKQSSGPLNPFAKQNSANMAQNAGGSTPGRHSYRHTKEEQLKLKSQQIKDGEYENQSELGFTTTSEDSAAYTELEGYADHKARKDLKIPRFTKPRAHTTYEDDQVVDHFVPEALDLGLDHPSPPPMTKTRIRKTGIKKFDYTDTEQDLNSENAPDYPLVDRGTRTETLRTKKDENGELDCLEAHGNPELSELDDIYRTLEPLETQVNGMYSETEPDWSQFESLGTLQYILNGDKKSMQKVKDLLKVDYKYKIKRGTTKLELPRLKPGAKIPKGWMITEDGFCVPQGKESVHHKYADPDLYQTPLHERLADLVQERLPKALKLTPQERESMLEVTSSGQHLSYERHREKMLENPLISDVIAKINERRGPAKVMDFEENVDLTFKHQMLSPFRKTYRYRMTAQGHALIDIPDSLLLQVRNRKERAPHRPPGPSMDFGFTSTAYHKGTH